MNNRKTQNSIIALAIGLLLTVVSLPLFAQTEKLADVSFNKQPLIDFGREMERKIGSKEIDLNSPFAVEMSGVIYSNGRLDPEMSKIVRTEGDQKVTDTIKDAILAYSDAGLLQYFQGFGINEVNILAKQDSENTSWAISAIVKKRERANRIASGLKIMLAMASTTKSNEQNSDELFLLRSMRAGTDNDKVFIEFAAPKDRVHEIIRRALAK